MGSKSVKQDTDWKALRASLDTWKRDAISRRESSIASTTARLAASGIRKGSPNWVSAFQRIEDTFQRDIEDIDKSKTMELVSEHEWENEQKRIASENRIKKDQEFMAAGITKMEVVSYYDSADPWYNKPIEDIKSEMYGSRSNKFGYSVGGMR